MELLTSLPAELVALADPAARGAAPLLRPGEADASSTTPPASFEAFLALLTRPLPTGEASPQTGKDLPPAPLDTVAAAAGDATLDAAASATSATDAALLARLRFAMAKSATDASAASIVRALPGSDLGVAAPLQSAELPATAPSVIADGGTAVDLPVAAPEPVAEAVPIDGTEPLTQSPSTDSAELASWLDSLPARDERGARSAAAAEARPPPTLPSAATPAPAAAVQLPAEAAAVVRDAGLRNNDAPKISTAAGVSLAEAPGVSRPEWLPAGHASPTTLAPAAAPPSTPIDVRSQGWQDAFANRVQWLVDSNVDEARITLHPPELGAVDIDISLVDDKTFVQMTAATTAARDELSQSLPRLRELFAASGLELGGASVHDGRAQQHAGDGSGARAASSPYFAPLAELTDEVPVAARPRPLGRIDVFA